MLTSNSSNTPTQTAHTTSSLSSTSSSIASNIFHPSPATVMTTTPTHPPDGYNHSKVAMTSPVASAMHELPSWVNMSQSKILPRTFSQAPYPPQNNCNPLYFS